MLLKLVLSTGICTFASPLIRLCLHSESGTKMKIEISHVAIFRDTLIVQKFPDVNENDFTVHDSISLELFGMSGMYAHLWIVRIRHNIKPAFTLGSHKDPSIIPEPKWFVPNRISRSNPFADPRKRPLMNRAWICTPR